jgi:ATP-dependent DNA helicase RecG
MKNWEQRALELLDKSFSQVPHELNELDWKENISPNHEKLSHHLSAFANYTGGGFLIFGIDDKTAKPIGITMDDSKRIISTLDNRARASLEPVISIEYSHLDYDGKNVLIVFIQESVVKPVHMKKGTIEDSYIRSGGSTRKVSRSELGGLILNSRLPRWEEIPASSLLPESEVLKLLDYHTIYNLLNRPIPTTNQEILDWLESEKMVIKNNNSGYFITNFGAIAAARNMNDFQDIARKAIRVIRYKGLNKITTEREFPGQKGYALAFNGLIEFLRALLPQSEIIKKAFRYEKTVYPEIALRELIANSLIHQDFTIRGKGPMIEIFDDRIEFTNPGKLLASKTIDRLIGTSPESRNEILASAFRRYQLCEERGTGFIKSVAAIELYGLPPLKFDESENDFKVTLFSPRTFAQMAQNERIQACYQHAILKHLSSSSMTNTTLRERFKMHEKQRPMISKLIKEALDRKVIKLKDIHNKSPKYSEYLPYWA